jgi:hypothetical protein
VGRKDVRYSNTGNASFCTISSFKHVYTCSTLLHSFQGDHGIDNFAAASLCRSLRFVLLWGSINYFEVLLPPVCSQNMGLGRLHCRCYSGSYQFCVSYDAENRADSTPGYGHWSTDRLAHVLVLGMRTVRQHACLFIDRGSLTMDADTLKR